MDARKPRVTSQGPKANEPSAATVEHIVCSSRVRRKPADAGLARGRQCGQYLKQRWTDQHGALSNAQLSVGSTWLE
eukprot:9731532-Alexandrium_andersonii.AAC.1